mgnify:FL=1
MLENTIADNPESALFPMLAEQFLLNSDFEKAHEVCSRGMSFYPESIPGLFMDARIFMVEGEFRKAEQQLKEVIFLDPVHYNGHVLLAECQIRLGRADSTLKKLFTRILEMDENNNQAGKWLASAGKKKSIKSIKKAKPTAKAKVKTLARKTAGKKAKTKKKAEAKVKEKAKVPANQPAPDQSGGLTGKKVKEKRKIKAKSKAKPSAALKSAPELKISPEIATFTLVAVLKSQHLYSEALDVLAVMSRKKGADKERIKDEREKLKVIQMSVGDNR